MRPPEVCLDGKLLLLPSYGGCDMFVYDMKNKLNNMYENVKMDGCGLGYVVDIILLRKFESFFCG